MRTTSYSLPRVLTLEFGSVIFFGVWLMVVLFYVLTSTGPSPIAAPYVNTPTCSNNCSKGLEYAIIVHLDAQDRFHLSANQPHLLGAIIQRVAKQHNVLFTPQQEEQLEQLPFLSQDVRQLPKWLDMPPARRQLQLNGIPLTLENDSGLLTELLLAGLQEVQNQSPANILSPPPNQGVEPGNDTGCAIAIRADKTVSSHRVMALIHQFEEMGIRRIKLVTEME
ncbi:hypothetical protein PK28_06345 [Hymenobacter sp. DG25B]|uniref:hypothetical protein n=1 Tax=Hymenobacter sp. DG25B TaxID=1385664 RepID=UPI000540FA0E|nr:hypothetical protein [Hymenobacter sp. DG25B]AIZ63409.1 hypothetical protein PK28_06345 [Hymenobacter sp. DG25B]